MATSTDEHKSLQKLNLFKLAKAIDNGKISNITKLSNNFLFSETNSAKQSQALLNTNSREDIPVNITPHNSLNFTRGQCPAQCGSRNRCSMGWGDRCVWEV